MLTNDYTRQRDRQAVKDWNRHIDTDRFQEPAQATVKPASVWVCSCGWQGQFVWKETGFGMPWRVRSCADCGGYVWKTYKRSE